MMQCKKTRRGAGFLALARAMGAVILCGFAVRRRK